MVIAMSKLVIVTMELAEAKAILKELEKVPLAPNQKVFGEGLRKLDRAIHKCVNGHVKPRYHPETAPDE